MDAPTLPRIEHPASSRIFAVVVLYRQSSAESVSVRTLARALQAQEAPPCTVLLYDNTPPAERIPAPPPHGFLYQAAESNRGMLGALEAALAGAARESCGWLLTLDQDTELPENYFSAVQTGLAAAQRDARIGAIVPHLAEGARRLSPAYVGIGRARPLPAGFEGTPPREARAFNSGALLRADAIQTLGGFDPCFWLDHFDNWLHHQLYVRGWRMHVLGALTVQHQFSLLDYRNRVSKERYRNFIGAEGAYIDLYERGFARLAYTAQLTVRWINQIRRGDTPDIRNSTRIALWRRLTWSRAARIAHWRRKMNCTSATGHAGTTDAA